MKFVTDMPVFAYEAFSEQNTTLINNVWVLTELTYR